MWLQLPRQESRVLSRELIYTGLTRARHGLHVAGSESVLCAALARQAVRVSGLAWRLGVTGCNTVPIGAGAGDAEVFGKGGKGCCSERGGVEVGHDSGVDRQGDVRYCVMTWIANSGFRLAWRRCLRCWLGFCGVCGGVRFCRSVVSGRGL